MEQRVIRGGVCSARLYVTLPSSIFTAVRTATTRISPVSQTPQRPQQEMKVLNIRPTLGRLPLVADEANVGRWLCLWRIMDRYSPYLAAFVSLSRLITELG